MVRVLEVPRRMGARFGRRHERLAGAREGPSAIDAVGVEWRFVIRTTSSPTGSTTDQFHE